MGFAFSRTPNGVRSITSMCSHSWRSGLETWAVVQITNDIRRYQELGRAPASAASQPCNPFHTLRNAVTVYVMIARLPPWVLGYSCI